MKIGDRLSVQIEGVDVAEAVVEDIEDGNATLVIPATRLVVKIRQSLDLAATKEPEVDRILAGVVDADSTQSAAVEETNAPKAEAPKVHVPVAEVGEGIHNMNLDSSAID